MNMILHKLLKKTPELLLPVGNQEMCLAAIHNGADAIYLGVPEFNARGRTKDFSLDELREMIEFCHLYGVKVHLALNVLIFENELTRLANLISQLILLGPDAFIVQDLGLCTLIRQISPDVPIHGSTQMTVTNHESMELLSDLNIQRFVLGREVSIPEMALIRSQTQTELEVFVHGALCVAYSGQCFTSEGIGGRSANRGQCAQSCRLDYELFVDGQKRDLGDKRYLVSPQDLCGLEDIPQLMALGINSFKVEGRLKTPEYVAQAGQAYTLARYEALTQLELEKLKHKLGTTYSRGFFSGWLHGVDHQKLVDGTFSSHRGVLVGEVVGREKYGKILIKIKSENLDKGLLLQAGQGLVFAGKRELGGKIASITCLENDIYSISLWQSSKQAIPLGVKVYLNSDPQLSKELQQSFHSRESFKKIPIQMWVKGILGSPLRLEVRDEEHQVHVTSSSNLEMAENSPLTHDSISKTLGQLGGTCFSLQTNDPNALKIDLEDNLFLHHRELKELRQKATQELSELRKAAKTYLSLKNKSENYVESVLQDESEGENKSDCDSKLHLLLREKAQVFTLLELLRESPEIFQQLGDVILDYEFGKDYHLSVEALKSAGLTSGIATTRILKPKEYHHLKLIERINPDVVLVRNLGALQYLQNLPTHLGLRLKGDFSLNITNHLTGEYLLNKGLSTLCASYDLSASQLKEMLRASKSLVKKVEVTLHQYMPLFHMEHCVFAAFLSTGSSFRDCGKPCEKHRVELRDAYGNSHFLKADQECRNTMFQGKAQSAAILVDDLLSLGVRHYRLELLHESGENLQKKIRGHLQLLQRKTKGSELFQSLNLIERYGVDQGTLAREKIYHDRKKS